MVVLVHRNRPFHICQRSDIEDRIEKGGDILGTISCLLEIQNDRNCVLVDGSHTGDLVGALAFLNVGSRSTLDLGYGPDGRLVVCVDSRVPHSTACCFLFLCCL
jgi:hypothetical protein